MVGMSIFGVSLFKYALINDMAVGFVNLTRLVCSLK